MFKINIHDKIKKLRKENGYTLEELGKHVGVGKSTVRKWENGEIKSLRHDKIEKLSIALNTNPSYLLGIDESIAKIADALDAFVIILKNIYDDVVLTDIEDTGGYTVTLVKDGHSFTFDEVPYLTLFETVNKVVPTAVNCLEKYISLQTYDVIPNIEIISNDELQTLDLISKLDTTDKAEIRGEVKQMLKGEKYFVSKEFKNA